MVDQESCPTCGALPCDWVENPHTRAPTPPPVPAVTREELVEIIDQHVFPFSSVVGVGGKTQAADAILSRLAAGQPT